MEGYYTSDTTCMAHSVNGGDELLPFALCEDGLWHWDGNENYAGYTTAEIESRF